MGSYKLQPGGGPQPGALKNKQDTFQLKGLREITRQLTTWGQMQAGQARTNDNTQVFRTANYWHEYNRPDVVPRIHLSQMYRHQTLSCLVKLILSPPDSPQRCTIFANQHFPPHHPCKCRRSQPRTNRFCFTPCNG